MVETYIVVTFWKLIWPCVQRLKTIIPLASEIPLLELENHKSPLDHETVLFSMGKVI